MRDGSSIYEIGVGVGAWLLPLQMKYKNLELGGSDLSAHAVVIANSVLGSHFCYANAHDLTYAPADHYDFVTSFAVFYIAAATEIETINLVKQAVRLLKPKTGQLFVGYNSVHIPNDPPIGDGRINLRQEFLTDNAQLLGLSNVTFVKPSSLGGSKVKYDVYATRAAGNALWPRCDERGCLCSAQQHQILMRAQIKRQPYTIAVSYTLSAYARQFATGFACSLSKHAHLAGPRVGAQGESCGRKGRLQILFITDVYKRQREV